MIALASIICKRRNYAEAQAMYQQALDGLPVVSGNMPETLWLAYLAWPCVCSCRAEVAVMLRRCAT
eukprot:181628-Chlamydomonas_euryale.AAC.1